MKSVIPGYTLNETPIYAASRTIIYSGTRDADQRSIVAKILKNMHPLPDELSQFKHEFETAKLFRSYNNIVNVYSLEEFENIHAIIMENIYNPNLAEVIDHDGKFKIKDFLELAIGITKALAIVHQCNIIHKDINPANIMIDPVKKEIKIIDFGISANLPKERVEILNPDLLEGSLAYISPEQTGRMNRGIDYRTDYYSLGVTFYQMLTGKLPYTTKDSMKLVHYHLAVVPKSPHEVDAKIPVAISNIIMKLLAKKAEDRYQNAKGLLADLQACQDQLITTGEINVFPLGKHDVFSKFQISEKLYGRSKEVHDLLTLYERIAINGEVGLMLVSGYSGVGKSVLVHELYKKIIKQHSYFISGKFDLFKHNIPYSGLTIAFENLVKQILTESEERIAYFRKKILEHVGQNGKILLDIIPNLVSIIGEQPSVEVGDISENQNHLNYIFQDFIKAIATKDHPLVIFMDDLQWADSSSVKMLETLLTSDCGYLFIIGAYRTKEMNITNSLETLLTKINERDIIYEKIRLEPLTLENVTELISETVHRSKTEVIALAKVCHKKTNGNPFFLNQLLLSLYKDQLIVFDSENNQWDWQLNKIEEKHITDNVVDLMVKNIEKLPLISQKLLKFAACLGSQFNLNILAQLCNESVEEVLDALRLALQEGYITSKADASRAVSYLFSHDRIQQAAYSLISDAEKEQIHLSIAEYLVYRSQEEKTDKYVFDIANHYNAGTVSSGKMTAIVDKQKIVRFNFMAAKAAKQAGAFEQALGYIEMILKHTSNADWQSNYAFMLEVYTLGIKCAYLCARYELMESFADVALQKTNTILDKLNIVEVQLAAKIAQNQQAAALDTAIETLAKLGVKIPKQPTFFHILSAIMKIKFLLLGKKIPDLAQLPEMKNEMKRAAIKLLTSIYGAAYSANLSLFPLLICNGVILSLRYGTAKESALAYAGYGIISCGVLGEVDKGYQFGDLALHLTTDKCQDQKVNVTMAVNALIKHWKDDIHDILPVFIDNFQNGLDTGDFEFGAYSILDYIFIAYLTGSPLKELISFIDTYNPRINRMGQVNTYNHISIFHQGILNFIEPSDEPGVLIGKIFDESKTISSFKKIKDTAALFFIYLNKLILFYSFENYAEAAEQIQYCDLYGDESAGNFLIPVYQFYKALSLLANYSSGRAKEKRKIIKSVKYIRKKMQKWAKDAPSNYLHKHYILEAVYTWVVTRDKLKTQSFFDQAIKLAKKNKCINDEALANELTCKFYLEQGNSTIAHAYIENAYFNHLLWGADAKALYITKAYANLLNRETITANILNQTKDPLVSVTTTSKNLDISTILKSSQMISNTIILEDLLTKLMQLVIENAGAEISYLLLNKQGTYYIEACGTVNQDNQAVLQSIGISNDLLPSSIINYVIHTNETVRLDNASKSEQFMKDKYIQKNKTKSILCLPLLNQGILTGLLYMENNLTEAAFAKERISVLELLSSQIAIAIDNARLYSGARDLNEQLLELNKSFDRFVPHDFLSLLNKQNIADVKLGDQTQASMSVLFADIRDFTARSEKMTPQENFNFINSILTVLSPIIKKYHGFIDKYIGDAIMALFPGGADDALQCAIEMQKAILIFNQANTLIEPVKMGIGINTGSLMLGTVGEENRMNVTVISDTVNIAARVEALTKSYGSVVLMTDSTYKNIKNPNRYQIEKIGQLPIRGKKIELVIYGVKYLNDL